MARDAPPSFRKRLRVSEPDLTIVVVDDQASSSSKRFQCHSLSLALQSKYFDTLLSAGFQETTSQRGGKQVVLRDVAPATFELGMEILENPVKANSVSAAELVQVGPFYDRFEFTAGLALCDTILSQFISNWTGDNDDRSMQLDEFQTVLGALALAAQAPTLHQITAQGIEFIKTRLDYPFHPYMDSFNLESIRMVQPFMVANPECLQAFLEDYELEEDDERPATDSSEFPTWLIQMLERIQYLYTLKQAGIMMRVEIHIIEWDETENESKIRNVKVRLEGTGMPTPAGVAFGSADKRGLELITLKHLKTSDHPDFGIKFQKGDWSLSFYYRDEKYIFVHPLSAHHLLPPAHTRTSNWLPLHSEPESDRYGPRFSCFSVQHAWKP